MMAGQSPRRRTGAGADSPKLVRISVPLRAEEYARLSAYAALSGIDRGAAAAAMILAGLKGIVVMDRRKSPGPVNSTGGDIGGGEAA